MAFLYCFCSKTCNFFNTNKSVSAFFLFGNSNKSKRTTKQQRILKICKIHLLETLESFKEYVIIELNTIFIGMSYTASRIAVEVSNFSDSLSLSWKLT